MRALFVAVRVLGAAGITAAIIGQLVTSVGFWNESGVGDRIGNLFVNFFSFFTIDSNVGAVVVLAIGAVLLVRRAEPGPAWFGVLRAAVTSYMVVTGIVYNTLLRGVNVSEGSVLPWSNEVLHVVGPLLILVDYLFAPGRAPLPWKTIWAVISFPLVWAVYTMIRGPLAYNDILDVPTWYPYPFLNPANSPEGYVSVAFYVVLIAAVIGGVGAAVVWFSRRGQGRALRADAAEA